MKHPLFQPTADLAPVRAAAQPARESWRTRLARRAVLSRLAGLEDGRIEVFEAGASVQLGRESSTLAATLFVRDPRTWTSIASRGSIGAGEAYLRGWWTSDDLVGAVRIFVRNRAVLEALDSGLARWTLALLFAAHRSRANTERQARANIGAHYDLSNDFYALFLDPSLTYSAAMFARPDETLAAAQERKLDTLCKKLALSAGERVIEIGSGWGSFAIHAATRYGVHVTTTTISRAQRELALERVRAAGVSDRVTVLERDYRQLEGQFDKLISIEMIEAVGHNFLDEYFAACARLLAPHGRAAFQAILMRDALHAASLRSVDFIQHYIFPGSQLPSLASIEAAVQRSSDLQLVDFEDLTPSYALTLERWREAFLEKLALVRALGFTDEFVRMWEFYLAYCEGGFREHAITSAQLVFAKPRGGPNAVAPRRA